MNSSKLSVEDWHITLKNDKQWRQFFQDNVAAVIAQLQKETEGKDVYKRQTYTKSLILFPQDVENGKFDLSLTLGREVLRCSWKLAEKPLLIIW